MSKHSLNNSYLKKNLPQQVSDNHLLIPITIELNFKQEKIKAQQELHKKA